MKRSILLVTMLMLSGLAVAQSQPGQQGKPQTAPAQTQAQAQAQAVIEPNALRDAGLRVAQAIDAGKEGELWDGSSQVTKKAVKREDFVTAVRNQRKAVGAATGRRWVAVNLQEVSGKDFPPGLYATARFAVAVANNRVLAEVVTFRLDEDGVWRFVGYVIS